LPLHGYNGTMPNIYDVVIRNGRIEWASEPPPLLRGNHPVHAQVRLLEDDEPAKVERGVLMAKVMEELSKANDVGLPADPDRWLRDEREDRPLPRRAAE